jgi:hypothetical protein
MVTTAELDRLRRQNFGIRTLSEKVDADVLLGEISRYDPKDAAEVSRRIRTTADLGSVIDDAVVLFREVIEEFRRGAVSNSIEENQAVAEYLRWMTVATREKQAQQESMLASSPTLRLRNQIGQIPLLEKLMRPLARWARRNGRNGSGH